MVVLSGDARSWLEIHGSKTQNGADAGDPDVETINGRDRSQGGKNFLGKKRLVKEHSPGHQKREMQTQHRPRREVPVR